MERARPYRLRELLSIVCQSRLSTCPYIQRHQSAPFYIVSIQYNITAIQIAIASFVTNPMFTPLSVQSTLVSYPCPHVVYPYWKKPCTCVQDTS